jgi:hypothetical protein
MPRARFGGADRQSSAGTRTPPKAARFFLLLHRWRLAPIKVVLCVIQFVRRRQFWASRQDQPMTPHKVQRLTFGAGRGADHHERSDAACRNEHERPKQPTQKKYVRLLGDEPTFGRRIHTCRARHRGETILNLIGQKDHHHERCGRRQQHTARHSSYRRR